MSDKSGSGNGAIIDGFAALFGTAKKVLNGEKKLEDLGEEACQDQSGVEGTEAKTNPPPANVRHLHPVKP